MKENTTIQFDKEQKKTGQLQRVMSASILTRQDRMKEIDIMYNTQINKLFHKKEDQLQVQRTNDQQEYKQRQFRLARSTLKNNPQKQANINRSLTPVTKNKRIQQTNISQITKPENIKLFEQLRRQSQTKQIKINNLTNICENLIEKLKLHITPQQINKQLQNFTAFTQHNIKKMDNLRQLKGNQSFFKIKLQTISAFQQLQFSKDDIFSIQDLDNEVQLFNYFLRKIKLKFKQLKNKEHQYSFQIKKDKIIAEENQQRVHYLEQTNELLKSSEYKLKQKNDQLRKQMNLYLDKLRHKEQNFQQKQTQLYKLKNQHEQMKNYSLKVSIALKKFQKEVSDLKKLQQFKQHQYKQTLNSAKRQQNKLQQKLQQKQNQIEQLLIKTKFIQQQNDRVNRQYIRWKQRFQSLQRQKQETLKDKEDHIYKIQMQFNQYQQQFNEQFVSSLKNQTLEALQKVQQYQDAYQSVLEQIQEERRVSMERQEQLNKKYQLAEQEWFQKLRGIEQLKQLQVLQLSNTHLSRQQQLRLQYVQREQLFQQQMQTKLKTILAEHNKKMTQRMIELQDENQALRKQVQSLHQLFQVNKSIVPNSDSKFLDGLQ